MTGLEMILDLTMVGRDDGAERTWRDLAMDHGYAVEVITDDEAEFRRVEAAVTPGDVRIIDGVPRPPRQVRCGGLRAIEPSEGGNLKGWLAARVARLWRAHKGGTLFVYVTKRKRVRFNAERPMAATVRKKQRWESREYVDLARGDSPAHLSGFPPGPDGKAKVRGVSGPRTTEAEREDAALERTQWLGETRVLRDVNRQFDFTGGTT